MAILQQSDNQFVCPDHGITTNFTGNTIPHAWYTQITSESGRPDHNAISIFSEIVYWYRPGREGVVKFKDDIWQTSYKHFETRFGYNNQRTRRALIRLEELGLIRREFRTIEKYGRTYTNILFIRLISMPQDNSIFAKSSSEHKNYDNICPEMSTGELVINTSLNEMDDASTEPSKKMYLPLYKFDTPSLQICREHIDIENKRENKEKDLICAQSALSISSSFLLLDKKSISPANIQIKKQSTYSNETSTPANEKNLKTENHPGILSEMSDKAKKLFVALASKSLKSKPLDWQEGRVLSELSDISVEEKDILNKRSGREFSLNFINQLILKLGVKCPEHRFFRRKQFMNYMVKALINEIFQAPQANNENFKFACLPKTKEELYLKQVHKYLEEIESSTNNSVDMRLSKKILGRLEPRLAYEILSGTSLSVCKTGEVDDNDIELMELEVKILRPLKIDQLESKEIPDWIEKILLEEVRGIYGEGVANIIVKNAANAYNYWSSQPKATPKAKLKTDTEKLDIESLLSNSPWSKVRTALRKTYGLAADNAWFSKLQILDSVGEDKGADIRAILKISTPTSFVRDWVKTHYGPAIENELKQLYSACKYVEFVCVRE